MLWKVWRRDKKEEAPDKILMTFVRISEHLLMRSMNSYEQIPVEALSKKSSDLALEMSF